MGKVKNGEKEEDAILEKVKRTWAADDEIIQAHFALEDVSEDVREWVEVEEESIPETLEKINNAQAAILQIYAHLNRAFDILAEPPTRRERAVFAIRGAIAGFWGITKLIFIGVFTRPRRDW